MFEGDGGTVESRYNDKGDRVKNTDSLANLPNAPFNSARDLWTAILVADSRFDDTAIKYCLFPEEEEDFSGGICSDGFNSNSFVTGIIQAVTNTRPVDLPSGINLIRAPGGLKPIPASEFQ